MGSEGWCNITTTGPSQDNAQLVSGIAPSRLRLEAHQDITILVFVISCKMPRLSSADLVPRLAGRAEGENWRMHCIVDICQTIGVTGPKPDLRPGAVVGLRRARPTAPCISSGAAHDGDARFSIAVTQSI